jgi:CelD/BcsL family acetyltransferase involved in cellulose biosynthesis
MERFARRGIARVFQLEIGGEVVAMRLGFRFGDSLYLYYSGFDPAWSRYSVMTTVVAETIRHALEHGVAIVNLSTGADESKMRWRPEEVAYADAVIVAPGLRARIAHRSFMAAKAWAERRGTTPASPGG